MNHWYRGSISGPSVLSFYSKREKGTDSGNNRPHIPDEGIHFQLQPHKTVKVLLQELLQARVQRGARLLCSSQGGSWGTSGPFRSRCFGNFHRRA